MKNTIIVGLLILLLGFAGYTFFIKSPSSHENTDPEELIESATSTEPIVLDDIVVKEEDKTKTVIGSSVEGNDITAYHYGTGDTEVLLIGGIHGGYSNNTVTLAYEMMDYYQNNSGKIADNVKLTIIPVVNPDGLNKTVGSIGRFNTSDIPTSSLILTEGRFNANGVDLNRNFACDWQKEGKWQNKAVSGGSSEFSEPESQALKTYIESANPSAVVVWYSSAGGVYSSNCHNGVLPETKIMTQTFSKASGYPAHEDFDFYEITGDAVNWMAKKNIPAISVLLTNHTDTEEAKNIKGVNAILELYSN